MDEWHCLWTVANEGMLGQVTVHPLAEYENLKTYRWPKASEAALSWENTMAKKRGDKYVIMGGIKFFERMVDLRGFENTMTDIAERPPEFLEVCDRLLEYNLETIDRLLALEPDGIFLADDWGSQISLMINPDIWRELFLPFYKKMFGRVRQAGRHVFFHTDGYTMDILPDLADAGANVFWVDLTVNPLTELKEKLGGRVCFLGLTDVQFTLRWGTPADVEKHVKGLIEALGSYNGGFIACSEAAADQPWENIKAVYEAFERYG